MWCETYEKSFRLKTNECKRERSAKMEGIMKKFFFFVVVVVFFFFFSSKFFSSRVNMKIFMVFCALFGTRTWIEKLNSYRYEFRHTCQRWPERIYTFAHLQLIWFGNRRFVFICATNTIWLSTHSLSQTYRTHRRSLSLSPSVKPNRKWNTNTESVTVHIFNGPNIFFSTRYLLKW